jgi:hypothetical protein
VVTVTRDASARGTGWDEDAGLTKALKDDERSDVVSIQRITGTLLSATPARRARLTYMAGLRAKSWTPWAVTGE